MSFIDDWVKLLILEVKPGRQLNELAWSAYPVAEADEIDYMEYATDAAARAAYVTNAALPTGGTITTSGTKRIHTFTANGTFALPAGVSGDVEVLVVAGGGGGAETGTSGAGGGGGGGVQYSAALALSAGESVAVTVGGGGAGGNANPDSGDDGGNSVFKTLTATGGGGGAPNATAGRAGGCGGGGGGGTTAGTPAGGAGSQGGDGGKGNGSSTQAQRHSGGGGGAKPDAGDNASSSDSGDGGEGYASSISGSAVKYAGGGGGAGQTGHGAGVDGGGNGGGGAGTNGLGGGGGGNINANNGGAGGSGVVIISYVLADFYALQSASESTIKSQGSYSLKVVAKATGSLNKTLTRTIGSPLDLSGKTSIKFDLYAGRTGSNIKIGIHDSGGTTTEYTPNVASAGAWATYTWDISAVADADKDAIDSIIITIVEASADNTFYVDNFFAEIYPVYYADLDIGEIVEVEEDGVDLSKQSSSADVLTNASSFYHDFFAGRLYVHLAAGDDPSGFTSPDYNHSVVAFVWKCFSNRQRENGETIDFVPEGCDQPHYYEPSLRPGTLSELAAAIADHFESAMQTTFGSVAIANDGALWYDAVDDWYWGNKDARVKVGEIGDVYADLETIFVGKVRSPEVDDVEVTFELVDTREGRLISIPPDHYEDTTYPNINPDAIGLPIPILFGEKHNISPVCIDTVNHKYKISATHFNDGADVFELESIDAVYLKGVGLSITTHYTEDLHNGEITLTFDPGDAGITVDAKGIKDGFDFDSSPFGAATGVYSENVADHLFFVLNILNEIPIASLDLDSFSELQAVRTQNVAWLLDTDTPTIDFNRLLQQTSLYHFLPLNNGTFAARYYRKSVPDDTLELRDFDYQGFRKMRPNDGVFRDIFLKYDKDPTTGEWSQVINSEGSAEYNHGTREPYVVETALRDESEALSVLAFYVSLLKAPPTKIETSISMVGRALIPTDKLYVNREVRADGRSVSISIDEVYVILETRRNMAEGRIEIVAQKDTQLAIYTVHADSPHQDVAHDDHSDTIHEDASHGNSHTDTAYINHSDNTHGNVAYIDEYSDSHDDHSDGYYDDYEDDFHNDVAHVDTSYTDHDDTPYANVPHVDTSHVDHDDTIHEDAHTDVSHIDSEV